MLQESGYYWIKIDHTDAWMIGFWDYDRKRWEFMGDEVSYDNEYVGYVNPQRILPPQN